MIFLRDKLPSSSVFSHLFQKSLQISHRFTRFSSNENKLYIPLYRIRLQRSIRYQGVFAWNSIPMKIQNLPKHSFKVKLKEYLYNCTFDDELDHLLSHFIRAIYRLKVLNEH